MCSWPSETPITRENVAELKIAAAAADLGIGVLKPMIEHERYDLAFEIDNQILRVQCKWANRVGDVIVVRLGGSYHSPSKGYVTSSYSAAEIDGVAAYCGGTGVVYYLPIELVQGLRMIHLRLAPARNGQEAAIHWATEYELARGCSSAGRASGWQPLGRGFESPQLHHEAEDESVLGSEEVRRYLGRYTHRAAAGETFHVTRRGKPFCTLSPPLRPEEGDREPPPPGLDES